jgi:16S rRNA (adenine1518-N6/adenine1519-N6)-dimethyltransferase
MVNLPSLKEIIRKYDLAPKKSLGQNFILDSNITDKIVKFSGDLTGINVIEIGAGPGGLTRSILTSNANKVFAVEKDERCVTALAELTAVYGEKLQIISQDAMEVNLSEIVPSPRSIIANLPYNVGTILLIKWLNDIYNANPYLSLTLMFQKEVAERLYAEPNSKQYGRLSVMTQWLCAIEDCFELPPSVFFPPPKIMSSVVRLIPHTKPLYECDKEKLEKTLASAFGNRRKMLRSALSTISDNPIKWLKKANIDEERRAETLSVQEFCELANNL